MPSFCSRLSVLAPLLVLIGVGDFCFAQQSTVALLPSEPVTTLAIPAAIPRQSARPSQQDQTQPQTGGSTTEAGTISGTVTDNEGNVAVGATVILDGALPSDRRETVTNDNGGFAFSGLKAGIPYHVNVSANGFTSWKSQDIVLDPGQFKLLTGIMIEIEAKDTSVTVYASSDEIAVQQVKMEEQQRVLGFIPNFYVVYDSKNAVPLTPKLKFRLALKVSVDPVTIGGVFSMAGINQAADFPDYVQGAKGYGQRVGAVAADGFTDIMIGGAILPSLLHQDPRYFYQGTGSTGSRVRHALLSPFLCKGDSGHWQPNYSSLGGDLISGAISETYYPDSNRSASWVFGNFAIGTAERMLSGIAQEFILPRFTKGAHK